MTTYNRRQLQVLAKELPDALGKYPQLMLRVNDAVLVERQQQNNKWGNQRYSNLGNWLAILGEEFGEVCEAMQKPLGLETTKESDADDLYKELIQLAAVASAIAEQVLEGRGY